MRVYGFIPARSGSKGLPDKNILEIDGHPLMAYAIAFGRALGIDRVIVSTDSQKYADIAHRYGADCPYLRGDEASHDTAMEEDILADMAKNLPQHGIEMPDIWIRLKPTNPFRSTASVHQALRILESQPDVDSVRIVSEADARLCIIDEDGYLKPLLKIWDPDRSVMRRTEFPSAFSPFNLDVLRHNLWIERGSAYMGTKIIPVVDHKITGMDINDSEDFEMIKLLIESKPRSNLVDDYLESEHLNTIDH